VLEIDPLAQRISSMHAWQQTTADRLNRIEEKLVVESKEIAAVSARVTSLEDRFGVIATVQQDMKATNNNMEIVKKNFDQLKLDARDALTLSKEVKLFKTELQELQEDVTTVLHQAPATERLISQVQQNVEASTEQLMAMSRFVRLESEVRGSNVLQIEQQRVCRLSRVPTSMSS
jgi:peptidoglycan hydrolase CwlO-like protein